MRTQIIITSASVEKLKQKAREIKKESGIPHHAALDQVAKSAGFNHWHHVAESAKAFKPTEQACHFGALIAMDVKDAMDFRDPSGRFVEDPAAFAICADEMYRFIRESDEDGDMIDNDPHYNEDKREWMSDELMNYVFFRYTGSAIPDTVEQVVEIVRECSFWPPIFIWHKGTLQECPSDAALDEDGNVVGLRFSL